MSQTNHLNTFAIEDKKRLEKQLLFLHEKYRNVEQQLKVSLEQESKWKEQLLKLRAVLQDKENKIIELEKFEFGLKRLTKQNIERDHTLENLLEQNKKNLAIQSQLEQQYNIEKAHVEKLKEEGQELHLKNKVLEEMLFECNETEKRNISKIEQLKEKLDSLQASYYEEQRLKLDAENELENIRRQFDQLKEKVNKNFEEKVQKQCQIDELIAKLNDEKNSHQKTKEQLQEKELILNESNKELETIRSTLAKTIRDVKDLEGKYIEVVSQKSQIHSKMTQLQKILELQKNELREVGEKLQIALKNEQENALIFEKEKDSLQQELLLKTEEIHEQANAYKKIEGVCQELQKEQENLNQELINKQQVIENLKSEIIQLKESIITLEEDLQLAQQHLAKKVKDHAILQDSNDLQKETLNGLNEQNTILREKIDGLNLKIDSYQQIEKNGNEQIKNWEKKYVDLHDKWQVLSKKIDQYKKIEEKHLQMQSLLEKFNELLINEISTPNVKAELKSIVKPDEKLILNEVYSENKEEDNSLALFSQSSKNTSIRQSLFD
ncbi:MAG: hypothetical protein BGO10_08080 [Chlamydia sp. 32-24]|nr:MAG: hypothetical protein BGO10_08080 [Chlamydia sp. 32-24]